MGGLRTNWEMTVAEEREGENRERKLKMDHRRGGREEELEVVPVGD